MLSKESDGVFNFVNTDYVQVYQSKNDECDKPPEAVRHVMSFYNPQTENNCGNYFRHPKNAYFKMHPSQLPNDELALDKCWGRPNDTYSQERMGGDKKNDDTFTVSIQSAEDLAGKNAGGTTLQHFFDRTAKPPVVSQCASVFIPLAGLVHNGDRLDKLSYIDTNNNATKVDVDTSSMNGDEVYNVIAAALVNAGPWAVTLHFTGVDKALKVMQMER